MCINECYGCECNDPNIGCTEDDVPFTSMLKQFSSFIKDCAYEDEYIKELNKRKIGYIRADYDGQKWWNTIFPLNNELAPPQVTEEIDAVYEKLISSECFPNLKSLREFCHSNPDAANPDFSDDVYSFYYTGKHCIFLIRCITRSNDYNIYLNAFSKEDNGQ